MPSERDPVLVDSTFATPVNCRPLDDGADLVIHSATKYLGGHNDLLAGAVVGSASLVENLRKSVGILGGITGTFKPGSARRRGKSAGCRLVSR